MALFPSKRTFPSDASFFFVTNVRAVLAATNKNQTELASVADIKIDRLLDIFNTDKESRLELNEAWRIFYALQKLTGLSGYATFNTFCRVDIRENNNVFEELIRIANAVTHAHGHKTV